ncbi:hypothetical protein VKT23_016722 [Stygiomarasmius scandens]|uniref:Uncharacterized protein n=1 Tax=Marasmiellus scandens TaxID=2682957 RepID=A0ABR1ITW7_9AGAR
MHEEQKEMGVEFTDTQARNIHCAQHCPFRNSNNSQKHLTVGHSRSSEEEFGDDGGWVDDADDVEMEIAEQLGNLHDIQVTENKPEPLLPTRCIQKLPARYENLVVSNKSALVKSVRTETHASEPVAQSDAGESEDEELESGLFVYCYKTEPDKYGLFKVYESALPSMDPDESISTDEITDAPTFSSNYIARQILPPPPLDIISDGASDTASDSSADENIGLFPNKTCFRLMQWFYAYPKPSLKMLDSLVHDVLNRKSYKKSDLDDFRAKTEVARMDRYLGQATTDPQNRDEASAVPGCPGDGWYHASVSIPLPRARQTFKSKEEAPQLTIEGLWYRKPLKVIKARFDDPISAEYHLQGHYEAGVYVGLVLTKPEPAEGGCAEIDSHLRLVCLSGKYVMA